MTEICQMMRNVRVVEVDMKCFKTFKVYDGDTYVGAVQSKGFCWCTITHCRCRHGPWISYVGSTFDGSTNLQGLEDDFDKAVQRVVEAYHETLHGPA